jgi:hypothetical protein
MNSTDDNQAESIKNQIVLLKLQADHVTDNLVQKANLDNSTILSGDSMFSVQMYKLSDKDNTTTNAFNNSLPIVDYSECIEKLKAAYNITDDSDMMFVLKNYNESLNENESFTFKYNVYRYSDKLQLDTSICDKSTVKIMMPLTSQTNNSLFNLTLYKEMKAMGIDITNTSDPFFTDRCFAFKDPATGADTSLNYRRANYFQAQQPNCLGLVCNLTGINNYNYVECTCSSDDDSSVFNDLVGQVITSLSDINIEIVFCYSLIPVCVIFI